MWCFNGIAIILRKWKICTIVMAFDDIKCHSMLLNLPGQIPHNSITMRILKTQYFTNGGLMWINKYVSVDDIRFNCHTNGFCMFSTHDCDKWATTHTINIHNFRTNYAKIR